MSSRLGERREGRPRRQRVLDTESISRLLPAPPRAVQPERAGRLADAARGQDIEFGDREPRGEVRVLRQSEGAAGKIRHDGVALGQRDAQGRCAEGQRQRHRAGAGAEVGRASPLLRLLRPRASHAHGKQRRE